MSIIEKLKELRDIVYDFFSYFYNLDYSFVSWQEPFFGLSLLHLLGAYLAWIILKSYYQRGKNFFSSFTEKVANFVIRKGLESIHSALKTSFTRVTNTIVFLWTSDFIQQHKNRFLSFIKKQSSFHFQK